MIEFIEVVKTSHDPLSSFQTFIEQRGGKGFIYGFGCSANEVQREFANSIPFLHHTFTKEWEELSPEPLLKNDRSAELLFKGMTNLVEWNPINSQQIREEMTPEQTNLWMAEQEIGLINGVSFSLSRDFGFSGLGFHHESTEIDNRKFRADWERYGDEITRAAIALDERVRVNEPNFFPSLTPREIDCLSWLAMGFRPAEISFRLKISEKTFEKYVQGAKTKLKARTRDHAVVRALILNIIQP